MSSDDRTLPPGDGERKKPPGDEQRPAWRRPDPAEPTLTPADTQRAGGAAHETAAQAGGQRAPEPPDFDPTLREARTLGASDTRRVEGPLFDNRYRVVRTLGAGGFGRVDLVADTLHEDKLLALKIILPQHQDVKEFEGRFRNEIRVLRALQHPGIPQIFNDGRTEQGEFYFTMDYVDGTPLEDVLKREQVLEPDRIIRLVRQVISILDYAHSKGVVHRDLKPANIILLDAGAQDEQVRVLDFGIAKILRKEGGLADVRTMDTMGPMGTPHYMSPEQVRGKDVDPRADLYALGVLIYHMVSRRFPFKGKTAMEIATARLETEPAPLDVEDTPVQLRALVKQLLEREREKRPDIAEIQRMLGEIASGQHTLRRVGKQVLVGGALLFLAVLLLLRPWKRTSSAEGVGTSAPAASGRQQASSTANGKEPTTASAPPRQMPISIDDEKPNFEVDEPPGRRVGDVYYLDSAAGLRGRVTDNVEGASLHRDNGVPVPLDDEGRFTIGLFEGTEGRAVEKKLVLVAHDHAGNEEERSFTFRYDPARPVITLRCEGEICADGQELLVFKDSATVEVTVKDDYPDRLLLDGEEREQGAMTLTLEGEASRTFAFEALDLAGNKGATSLSLRRGTRLEGPLHANGDPLSELVPYETSTESLELSGTCDHAGAELRLSINESDVEVEVGDDRRFASAAVALTREINLIHLEGPGLDRRTWKVVLRRGRAPEGWKEVDQAGIDASGWFRKARNELGMIVILVPPPAAPYSFDGLTINPERPFYISETEVTWEQYGTGDAPQPDHPASKVSFEDAKAFCERSEGRLPTEEEWLHVACGPARNEYPWGAGWDASKSSLGEGTTAVYADLDGRSWCGALGMAGNVSEWCTGPSGEPRLRGCSYFSEPEECKASEAPVHFGADGSSTIGFRVVVEIEEARSE